MKSGKFGGMWDEVNITQNINSQILLEELGKITHIYAS